MKTKTGGKIFFHLGLKRCWWASGPIASMLPELATLGPVMSYSRNQKAEGKRQKAKENACYTRDASALGALN